MSLLPLSIMEIAGFVTIILLAAAVSALIFSCKWCRQRMMDYNEFMRQHEARQQQLNSQRTQQLQHPNTDCWVYTIERGYQTNLISYNEGQINQLPSGDGTINKKDGLPTYEEAVNLPPSYQTRNEIPPVTVAVTSV